MLNPHWRGRRGLPSAPEISKHQPPKEEVKDGKHEKKKRGRGTFSMKVWRRKRYNLEWKVQEAKVKHGKKCLRKTTGAKECRVHWRFSQNRGQRTLFPMIPLGWYQWQTASFSERLLFPSLSKGFLPYITDLGPAWRAKSMLMCIHIQLYWLTKDQVERTQNNRLPSSQQILTFASL